MSEPLKTDFLTTRLKSSLSVPHSPQPLYSTVRYNMVLDIHVNVACWTPNGHQRLILLYDYSLLRYNTDWISLDPAIVFKEVVAKFAFCALYLSGEHLQDHWLCGLK